MSNYTHISQHGEKIYHHSEKAKNYVTDLVKSTTAYWGKIDIPEDIARLVPNAPSTGPYGDKMSMWDWFARLTPAQLSGLIKRIERLPITREGVREVSL